MLPTPFTGDFTTHRLYRSNRQSALPHARPQRGRDPEWVRTVADADFGTPKVISPPNCPCPRPFGLAVGLETGAVHPTACKRRTCPVCGPRQVSRLRRRTLAFQPTHFITFHFGWHPDRENMQRMHRTVRAIMRDWERYLGVKIEAWTRCDEIGSHSQHVLHIHTLVRIAVPVHCPIFYRAGMPSKGTSVVIQNRQGTRLPYQEMVQIAQRLSGAVRPMQIEWINNESRAAYYVTKYATKGAPDWWKYARPWYTSQPDNSKHDLFEPCAFVQAACMPEAFGEVLDADTGELFKHAYIGPDYIAPAWIAPIAMATLYPCYSFEIPREVLQLPDLLGQEGIK